MKIIQGRGKLSMRNKQARPSSIFLTPKCTRSGKIYVFFFFFHHHGMFDYSHLSTDYEELIFNAVSLSCFVAVFLVSLELLWLYILSAGCTGVTHPTLFQLAVHQAYPTVLVEGKNISGIRPSAVLKINLSAAPSSYLVT